MIPDLSLQLTFSVASACVNAVFGLPTLLSDEVALGGVRGDLGCISPAFRVINGISLITGSNRTHNSSVIVHFCLMRVE